MDGLGNNVYANVCDIVADLSRLIPVGTLTVFGIPAANFGYSGIHAPDEWSWLDLEFIGATSSNPEMYFQNELVQCLRYLMGYKYIVCTYKLFRIDDSQLIRIRIYAVPSDTSGFRFISGWRLSRANYRKLDKGAVAKWQLLLQLLDFSDANWELTRFGLVENGTILVPYSMEPSKVDNSSSLNFHLDRWYSGKKYSVRQANQRDLTPSLNDRVQRLYGAITSPNMSKYTENVEMKLSRILLTPEERLQELVSSATSGDLQIEGIKANLYTYQIISLARMYEKETIPQYHHLPGLLEFPSADNKTPYYVHIDTFTFYRNPDLIRLPRGGILAENMGLGKTLICLALVCLTKHDVTEVPEDLLLYHEDDDPDVRIISKSELEGVVPPRLLKSLVAMCVDFINENSMPWKYFVNDIPPQVVRRLSEAPGSFKIKLDYNEYNTVFDVKKRRSFRKKELAMEDQPEGNLFRQVYLSSTTIIVVPENLVHQWSSELTKHVRDDYLKKLFLSSHFTEIRGAFTTFMNDLNVGPLELINYDLIIISNHVFAKLFSRIDNPLLQVYWKRLIIDEGHSVNSKRSRTSLLCKSMLAERKWAVTGTPTSGLTNIYVDEEEESLKLDSLPRLSKYVIKNTFDERSDLAKLGNIVSNFLKIEPFHSQQKSWSNLIVKPLISRSYNAERALYTLLNNLMVRHNLLDIGDSLVLPQLHHEVVYLEPAFHNKLSVNLFAAVLAVNAVTSERTDVDYMFHPTNRMQLRRLITNLQRATFHWTGFTQNDVETLIKICNHALGKTKPDGSKYHTESDILLLNKSMEIAKTALSNVQWRANALLHEMSYYIRGLPRPFSRYFGVGQQNPGDLVKELSVFGAPHLNAIQDFVYKHRFRRFDDIQQFNEMLDRSSRTFWDRYWNDTLKNNENKFNKQGSQSKNEPILQADIVATVKTPEIVADFKPLYMIEDFDDDDEDVQIMEERAFEDDNIKELTFDSVRKAVVAGTASAKLSYLGARLLEHKQNGDKSIVFYEFEDSAYYLTELLDILGVNYILYATFNKPEQRAQNLSEFSSHESTSKGGMALIMDLKLASHGLTIISASKVYFLSPVWKTSIEAQAIKRAHRIGQTKEVHVETLVLKGTLEEEIYNRRSNNNNPFDAETYEEQTTESNHAIDDLGIQEFVLRHDFLEFEPHEEECCGFQAPSISSDLETNDEDADPYSLLHHELFVNKLTKTHIREWLVYLFNQDNLEKLTRSKNQKILERESRADFMKSFVTNNVKPTESLKRSSMVSKPRSKRVRF